MTTDRKKTAKAAWDAFDRLPKVEAMRDAAIADAARLIDERNALARERDNALVANKILAGKLAEMTSSHNNDKAELVRQIAESNQSQRECCEKIKTRFIDGLLVGIASSGVTFVVGLITHENWQAISAYIRALS